MEEVGELASALRNGTHEERLRRVRRRAGLAGHDRQRGGRRSDRGGDAEVRLGLSGLRPVRLHVSRRGKAMTRAILHCLLLHRLCCLRCRWPASAQRQAARDRRRARRGSPIATRSGLDAGRSHAPRRQRAADRRGVADRARRRRRAQPRATPPNEPCQVLPGEETTVRLFARFGRVNSATDGRASRDGGRSWRARRSRPRQEADAEHFLPGHGRPIS